ncbi:4Fe-4S single cluster domain-containing protein [Desulfonispora thiosulfatigenes DSM 11270]|uniref:4Fe-4S single cluster domain-containing protein n=1 Tax=Desulfonispora thiosulfatigenes DSM 11270 TaxID=656914 RepID=A0A1W1VTF0_DESTI|nr:4Fe-4S single cluster domain-containing protein [Desulfonispora thiosulfatigenes DSM 11270]
MTYTGHLFEHLLESKDIHVQELLKVTDLLIDGPFVNSKKDLNIPYRGSSNQRIIDVKESLKRKKTIIYEPNLKYVAEV